MNGKVTHDLILALFGGKISDPDSLAKWLEKNADRSKFGGKKVSPGSFINQPINKEKEGKS